MNHHIITPIRLNVRLTTQGRRAGARATIDSACEGILVNESWVWKHNLPSYPLDRPIRVRNVDDSTNKNDLITRGVDGNLTITDQQGRTHTERVQMFITNLGRDDMLLGTDWLRYHDPSIRWRKREVRFDGCRSLCEQPYGITKAKEEPLAEGRLNNGRKTHREKPR